LPASRRRALAVRWRRARSARAACRGLSHPLSIFVLHVGGLWIWHVPRLYEAALADRAIHAAEHASFLFTAMLFWWALVRSGGRRRWPGYGATVLYVFGTALQSRALGALLLFSPVPLYEAHAEGAALSGIDLIADQQVAAALMWVPAGLVYSAAALASFFAWLRSADQAATRRDGQGLEPRLLRSERAVRGPGPIPRRSPGSRIEYRLNGGTSARSGHTSRPSDLATWSAGSHPVAWVNAARLRSTCSRATIANTRSGGSAGSGTRSWLLRGRSL